MSRQRRRTNEAKRTQHAITKQRNYTHAVKELKNPRCCTTVTFFMLRLLTFPSTPVAAGTSRASCCGGRIDSSTPLLGNKNTTATANNNDGNDGREQKTAAPHVEASTVAVSVETSTTIDRTNGGGVGGDDRSTNQNSNSIHANELQVIGSRFLIAIFILDYAAAAVSRIMHLDVLDMAAVIPGMTVVTMDLIMTTLESIAELFGTTITPFMYRLMYPNDPIESRQLARFAVRVYAISNLIAFILYPIISGVTWIGCNITMGTLMALVALRTLQYSVVNQVGDAAVQMAKPHWLRTFAGTSMQIPGFDVGLYVRTQTTEDTLSAHIAFIVFVIAPVIAAIYLGVQDNPIPRLLVATGIAFVVTVLSFIFWYKEQVLTCGVQSEAVELASSSGGGSHSLANASTLSAGTNSSTAVLDDTDDATDPQTCRLRCSKCFGCGGKSGVIPLWSLQPFQISLICLNVVVKVVNEQVTNALTAVVLVSLGGTYRNLYIVGAGVIGVIYLLCKIGVEHCRMLKRDRSTYARMQQRVPENPENPHRRNDASVASVASDASGSIEASASIEASGNSGKYLRQHNFQMRLDRWVFVVCLICVCLAISSILLLSRPGISAISFAPSPSSSSSSSSSSSFSSSTFSLQNSSTACRRISEEGGSNEDQDPTYFAMTVAAIVLILPLYPAIKMFDVEYDAFLMDYERDRPQVVTSMSLWINVLSPICHLIMLGINYYAWVSASVDAAAGSIQVAVSMLTGVTVLSVLVLYYVILDRCCLTPRCSVRANLRRMDANIQEEFGGKKKKKEPSPSIVVEEVDMETKHGVIDRRQSATTVERVLL